VQGFLILTSITDMGHIAATAAGMGQDYFWNLGRWNSMAWTNIWGSVVMMGLRLATLWGVFGDFGLKEERKVESRPGKRN
jgi:hypothetical protein